MMSTGLHPPPRQRRLAPRPLELHLSIAATTWLSSLGALAPSKNVSPSSSALRDAAPDLDAQLAQAEPEALRCAVIAEIANRSDALASGIEAYRRHAYHRAPVQWPVIWSEGTTALLDCGTGADGPPVLVVPSLVNRSYILDLMPERSFVRALTAAGFQPLLIDWDRPGAVERGFDLDGYIVEAELNRCEPPDSRARQRAHEAVLPITGRAIICVQVSPDQALLGVRQPARLTRFVGADGEGQESHRDRRNALQQEQPLPVCETQSASHRSHDEPRHGTAQDARNWDRGKEESDHACTTAGWKPVRQIEHGSRQEPGLECTKKESQKVEPSRCRYQHGGHAGDAPEDRDACEGAASANPLEEQIAGNLEQQVAEIEDPRTKAVGRIAEAKVLHHL